MLISFSIVNTFIVFFFLIIPIVIGVYVYRDAGRRGMNAPLWTLLAVLAPTLIGFIIYLLVRSGYSDLSCPHCATRVADQYMVCPKCGARLKATCESCGFPVEADWSVCPHCASSLPQQPLDFSPPTRGKDTALWKILVLVILIPLLLLAAMAFFSFYGYGSGGGSTMGTAQISVEDLNDNPQTAAWMKKCDEDPTKTYALCYQAEDIGQKSTYYLIYTPERKIGSYHAKHNPGLFDDHIEVEFIEHEDAGFEGPALTRITSHANDFNGLKVYINGEKADCEITEVNYNPTI